MHPAPPFKRLYLHIGLSKTGTTSIQRDILENAPLLEERFDIHYPREFPESPPFNGNHSRVLRALFCEHPDAQRRLPTIGIHSDEELRAYQRGCREKLEEGFAGSGASTLLLSAESVCNFSDCDMAALAQWTACLAESVRVIACVRHPVHALSSEIQQRLRVGARLENLYRKPPYKRLRELFGRVEAQFGRENITAYSFHRALENPGGLGSEFFRQLGVESGESFTSRRTENSSISQEAALLLDALNRKVPQFIEGRANPERRRYSIQPLLSVPGPKYRVPAEVVERAAQASHDEVTWIAETYGLDLEFSQRPQASGFEDAFSDAAKTAIALRLASASASPAR